MDQPTTDTGSSGSPVFITRWIERAEKSVGVITLLLCIASFGAGALAFGVSKAVYISLAVFGVVGAVEVHHMRGHAKAINLAKPVKGNEMFFAIEKKHRWNPVILKEFKYHGFQFRILGFKELQVPLGVTPPLCPACQCHLAEKITVRFPGRIKIKLLCSCGWNGDSPLSIKELTNDAEQLGGLPTD